MLRDWMRPDTNRDCWRALAMAVISGVRRGQRVQQQGGEAKRSDSARARTFHFSEASPCSIFSVVSCCGEATAPRKSGSPVATIC